MIDRPTGMDRLLTEAFSRFGASLLWNVRRPPATAEAVRRIARRLAREGGAEAVALAARMLDSTEVTDARRGAEDGTAHPGGQP